MPELPEVEATRRGIAAVLTRKVVTLVVVRTSKLRYPFPPQLEKHLVGERLCGVARRGKYLLFDFGSGTLLLHLGMSGSLRLVSEGAPAEKHDHFDLGFGPTLLRLRDPRRFGAVLWLDGGAEKISRHPLLAKLGIEPFSDEFSARWLYKATRNRLVPIKQLLMDSRCIVGVGNIYASESLFRARINPCVPATKITLKRSTRLVQAIRSTLQEAIDAGGSSLRDFIRADGSAGDFQLRHYVYGRENQPCRVCNAPICSLRQGQRTSFYCPVCQNE